MTQNETEPKRLFRVAREIHAQLTKDDQLRSEVFSLMNIDLDDQEQVIEELRDEVKYLESTIEDLESTIDKLRDEVKDLESTIATI
jgi:uncharacterized coiled-coil protein SlyX